ncbi:hypothetical protein IT568_04255, partial [bacterium]|nr:hypothetical protein [bacterium]
MENKFFKSLIVTMSIGALASNSFAAEPVKKNFQPSHIAITDNSTIIDVNNIDMFVTNHGSFAYNIPAQNSGLYFPSGQTGKAVIYASGLWLGAKDASTGELLTRVGEYSQTFLGGPIVNGVPDDFTKPEHKVYKISKGDNASNNPDYANWPKQLGAPVNPDGTPQLLGDQTLWCVFNDLNSNAPTNDAASTAAMGVEIRQTAFAFDREGALGNIVFLKFQIFNKGAKTLQDTYVSLWADPDLGGATDDYVGCDTDLSLGYCYNADNDDSDYGSQIPAVGYDFFQGPMIPSAGDSAYAFGKYIQGFKNLPMSSFNKYINGTDPHSPDETYNYMKGLNKDGTNYVDPTTGQVTTYFLSGNPITRQGDLDANPADRRYMLSSGPFTMAPGDSQEVVAAVIIGQCGDNLTAIEHLKFYDKEAQTVFDNNFNSPSPPQAPTVVSNALDRKITFDWYGSKDDVENYPKPTDNAPNYAFGGYNVYQGETVNGPWKKIATFDAVDGVTVIKDDIFDENVCELISKPTQKGTDSGFKYSLMVTEDFIRNEPLKNGTTYYYSVSAYSFTSDAATFPKALESSVNGSATALTPQGYAPGSDFSMVSAADTSMGIVHTGISDGYILVDLVHDNFITGDEYEVRFGTNSDWWLWNKTKNSAATDTMTNQGTDTDDEFNYPIVDGFQVRVFGPAIGVKFVDEIQNASGVVAPKPADHVGDNVWFSLNSTKDWYCDNTSGNQDFARLAWSANVPEGLGDHDYEVRFTANGSVAFNFNLGDATGYFKMGTNVPFEVWDIGPTGLGANDPSDDKQLSLLILDNEYDQSHPDSAGYAKYDKWNYGDGIYALRDDYATTSVLSAYDPSLAASNKGFGRLVFVDYSEATAAPATGTVVRLTTNKPNTSNDVFAFKTIKPVVEDVAKAKKELDKMTPVPNPYYGKSAYEKAHNEKVIRFVNLPEGNNVTINIFNLAGDL